MSPKTIKAIEDEVVRRANANPEFKARALEIHYGPANPSDLGRSCIAMTPHESVEAL